jgi:hypothetical protein
MSAARSVGASPLDAEDAAVEAVYMTLSRLPSLNFDPAVADPLSRYLVTATKRRVYEMHRGRLYSTSRRGTSKPTSAMA